MDLSSDHFKNVSRETFLQLEKYIIHLQKWNQSINLIGKSTEKEIWERHIADGLQLLPLIPGHLETVADLGSGAGLPGVILAIARPQLWFTLIEKDQRKAAFLTEIVAILKLSNTIIINDDIKNLKHRFQVITARALAPLETLFSLTYPLMEPAAFCLFPKGKNAAIEIEKAKLSWLFEYTQIPSVTEREAAILKITGLSPSSGI